MDGKTWFEALTTLGSLVAVLVAVCGLYVQRRLEHETSTQTLIHDQYELCRGLDVLRVEHPEVSHMLALPAQSGTDTWKNYEFFRRTVRNLVSEGHAITEAMKARLYLQEHAVALHLFDIYEQTIKQLNLSIAARDANRIRVLDDLVEYYEKCMLRNPRVRFHWDHGGSDLMDKSTVDRCEEKVHKAYPQDAVDAKSPLEE